MLYIHRIFWKEHRKGVRVVYCGLERRQTFHCIFFRTVLFHYIHILRLKTMLIFIGAMGVLRKVLINFLIEVLTYMQRSIKIRNVQLSKF